MFPQLKLHFSRRRRKDEDDEYSKYIRHRNSKLRPVATVDEILQRHMLPKSEQFQSVLGPDSQQKGVNGSDDAKVALKVSTAKDPLHSRLKKRLSACPRRSPKSKHMASLVTKPHKRPLRGRTRSATGKRTALHTDLKMETKTTERHRGLGTIALNLPKVKQRSDKKGDKKGEKKEGVHHHHMLNVVKMTQQLLQLRRSAFDHKAKYYSGSQGKVLFREMMRDSWKEVERLHPPSSMGYKGPFVPVHDRASGSPPPRPAALDSTPARFQPNLTPRSKYLLLCGTNKVMAEAKAVVRKNRVVANFAHMGMGDKLMWGHWAEVEQLNVSETRLTANGAKELIDSIGAKIVGLDLSDNIAIGSDVDVAEALIDQMQAPKTKLGAVNLSNITLSDSLLARISVEGAARCRYLNRLNLSNNKISDKGGFALAEALIGIGAKCMLEELDLSWNHLSDSAPKFVDIHSLLSLNLSWNNLASKPTVPKEERISTRLSNSVCHNSTMLVLHLNHCCLEKEDTATIAHGVQYNHVLLEVHMHGNVGHIRQDALGYLVPPPVEKKGIHSVKGRGVVVDMVTPTFTHKSHDYLHMPKIRERFKGQSTVGWITGGWNVCKFKALEGVGAKSQRVFIHLRCDGFKAYPMDFNAKKKRWQCYRIVPAGLLLFYYTMEAPARTSYLREHFAKSKEKTTSMRAMTKVTQLWSKNFPSIKEIGENETTTDEAPAETVSKTDKAYHDTFRAPHRVISAVDDRKNIHRFTDCSDRSESRANIEEDPHVDKLDANRRVSLPLWWHQEYPPIDPDTLGDPELWFNHRLIEPRTIEALWARKAPIRPFHGTAPTNPELKAKPWSLDTSIFASRPRLCECHSFYDNEKLSERFEADFRNSLLAGRLKDQAEVTQVKKALERFYPFLRALFVEHVEITRQKTFNLMTFRSLRNMMEEADVFQVHFSDSDLRIVAAGCYANGRHKPGLTARSETPTGSPGIQHYLSKGEKLQATRKKRNNGFARYNFLTVLTDIARARYRCADADSFYDDRFKKSHLATRTVPDKTTPKAKINRRKTKKRKRIKRSFSNAVLFSEKKNSPKYGKKADEDVEYNSHFEAESRIKARMMAPTTMGEAIEILVRDHLKPFLEVDPLCGDLFREKFLYTKGASKLFSRHQNWLYRLFSIYASGEAIHNNRMDKKEWIFLLAHSGLMANGGCTLAMAGRIFPRSILTVIDPYASHMRTDMSWCFIDFLEGLGRLCVDLHMKETESHIINIEDPARASHVFLNYVEKFLIEYMRPLHRVVRKKRVDFTIPTILPELLQDRVTTQAALRHQLRQSKAWEHGNFKELHECDEHDLHEGHLRLDTLKEKS